MVKNTSSAFRHRHSISGTFVFLLLGVFAVFSTMMVVFSAHMYKTIQQETEYNADKRMLHNYIVNIVQANDRENAVRVENRNGVDMLILGFEMDDERYETAIYCHDGAIRELFMAAGDDFDPDFGEKIVSAREFSPRMEGHAFAADIVDESGRADTVRVALCAAQEEVRG